jgi:hypothetical protein
MTQNNQLSETKTIPPDLLPLVQFHAYSHYSKKDYIDGNGWFYDVKIPNRYIDPGSKLPVAFYFDLSTPNTDQELINLLKYHVRPGDLGTIYHSEHKKTWFKIVAISAVYNVVMYEIYNSCGKTTNKTLVEMWDVDSLSKKRILIHCWMI